MSTRDSETKGKALVRKAETLAGVGYCIKAAMAYMEAAELSDSKLECMRLKRLAAGQSLACGHIAEGRALVIPLLVKHGIPDPKPGRPLAMRLLWQLLMLGVWPFARSFPGNTGSGNPLAVERMDCCFTAGRGFVAAEPMTGLFYLLKSLFLALGTSDSFRTARSLCLSGAVLCQANFRLGRPGTDLLMAAKKYLEQCRTPYQEGLLSIAFAQASMKESRWKEMLRLCDTGVRILGDHCANVSWEITAGRISGLYALQKKGDIRELLERCGKLSTDSRQSGNILGQVAAETFSAYWDIARGNPALAREKAARAAQLFAGRSYSVQLFYAHRILVYSDVYEGQIQNGLTRLDNTLKIMKKSSLIRFDIPRLDAWILFARVNLAAAVDSRANRDYFLGRAAKFGRLLRKDRRIDSMACGHAVQAGVARLKGDKEKASKRLDASLGLFERAGMDLMAECVRFRQHQLSGCRNHPDMGTFSKIAVHSPEKWLDMIIPGFEDE